MRLFYFSILLIFLASCGTISQYGQLRLVKTGQNEVPVLEKNIAQGEPNKGSESVNEEQQLVLASSEEKQESPIDLQNQLIVERSSEIKIELEDLEPEEDSEEAKQAIVDQAIKAEKNARTSSVLLSAGLISLFMPYLGVIFYILGLIFYSKSKSSRYITPFGEGRLNTSKTLLIIDSVILGLWTLLFVFLLLLLFL